MKAAFFFDTFLLKKEESYYGMTLTYDFLKNRYLKYYDSLIVSTRVKDISEENGNTDGYIRTNGKNIDVMQIISYKNIPDGILRKKEIVGEVNKVLANVDVAIVRMPSMIGNIVCSICEKNDKKYIIEMVACAWDGYINHHNKYGKIVAPYMFIETKKHVKKGKKVLYVTNEFLQRRYPTKGEKISCSDVVLKDFNDSIIKKRLDKISKMNEEATVKICTVANVGLKYKGQEYILKALSKLKDKGNIKFNYYLIGNGKKEYLERIVKKLGLSEQVVFVGSLNHEDVFKMIDEMDLYIQPSLQEGMPRALLEAMSRGCPSIGSTAGGIPELLNKKYVFKKKDVDGIVNILARINKEELRNMAKLCYNMSKKFSKEILESRRNKFYVE